jgi:hypothetical protein
MNGKQGVSFFCLIKAIVRLNLELQYYIKLLNIVELADDKKILPKEY